MTFRIIKDSSYDAAMNMAIDEAIYNSVSRGLSQSTIRFYSFKPDSVSIGANQDVKIINLDFCNSYGINYVRRPSGGNAVFHNERDITYSVIANTDLFSRNIREVYKTICSWIVNSINEFGLNAEFYGKNDILINGKKICGNAILSNKDVFLQHGSLFIYGNKNSWANCLNIEKEKLNGVSCLSEITKRKNIERDLLGIMERNFTANAVINNDCHYSNLTPEEINEAKILRETKYNNNKFLFDASRKTKGKACIIDIIND